MKIGKILKIIGGVSLGFLLLVVAVIAFVIIKITTVEMAPETYETSVTTGGGIEEKYLARGTYEVAFFEEETTEVWLKYEIYYPEGLESYNRKYPVIVMANGSGVRASRYTAVFNHYASYGFIVIGNEHDTSFKGDSSDASIVYLMEANNNPNSIFYQKIDLENIGIVGHSQGGVGVFNAITSQPHADMYKTAVSLSPVGEEMAKALNWTYDVAKITIPTMVLAGTPDVISPEELKSLYTHIPTDKVVAIRSNTEHGEMLYSADGYVTAWFMWQLQGDMEAAKAFVGENAEISANTHYQDLQKSL